jgi:dTDP-4-dehydrorhamnose 3,5-epimerase
MNVIPASLFDVLILEPKVYGDERGFFFESYNEKMLAEKAGIAAHFVQDNHSLSAKNVLRGLHYQVRQTQGKLVRVIAGQVFDVAVDLRRSSPTFGKWAGINLSAANKRMVWIPPGFAHGFLVLSDFAEFLYKTTDYWVPAHERCIAWDDPDLNITWPLSENPVVSSKDQAGMRFSAAEVFA